MGKVLDLKVNKTPHRPRVHLCIPTTGVIRYEWHLANSGIIIPTNWESTHTAQLTSSTLGYSVAEARNLLVRTFLQNGREWLFFLDHDVLCPPNTFIWADEFMRKPPTPIIAGLYYTKSYPAEPLIYRGRGNGAFRDFKLGDQVWCDGMGMGFTMIHRELLIAMAKKASKIRLSDRSEVRQVFITPRATFCDPETGMWARQVGTEDLNFCTRVIESKALAKTRWKSLVTKRFPFLVDTRMFCWHMEISGQRFPIDIDLPPGFEAWKKSLEAHRWQSQG